MMKAHIHTDVIHLFVFALSTLAIAHLLRGVGAYLAGHGMANLGTPLGAFATLNGA